MSINSIIQNFNIIVLSSILVILTDCLPSEAINRYNFILDIDDNLSSQLISKSQLNGSFEFDQSLLTNNGIENISLTNFNFSYSLGFPTIPFDGDIFEVSFDYNSSGIKAKFLDGKFLELIGENSINLEIPFRSLTSVIYFDSDEVIIQQTTFSPFPFPFVETRGSSASITYTPVPEPLTILGAAIAIGFGTTFKYKLAQNQKK